MDNGRADPSPASSREVAGPSQHSDNASLAAPATAAARAQWGCSRPPLPGFATAFAERRLDSGHYLQIGGRVRPDHGKSPFVCANVDAAALRARIAVNVIGQTADCAAGIDHAGNA
jgi:hypothetical protein